MFVLVYLNRDHDVKRFKTGRYYLPKAIIKSYNVIINGKNFYDQPINCDIKQYEEIRRLTTGQIEDYATGCLLHYEYIKNHYRLIAVDLSRQKELDADPKSIQQVEFAGQLKNLDGINGDGSQNMFVLTILEKIKETRLKFSHGSVIVLYKMTNYQEARVKLTNTQLNQKHNCSKK